MKSSFKDLDDKANKNNMAATKDTVTRVAGTIVLLPPREKNEDERDLQRADVIDHQRVRLCRHTSQTPLRNASLLPGTNPKRDEDKGVEQGRVESLEGGRRRSLVRPAAVSSLMT